MSGGHDHREEYVVLDGQETLFDGIEEAPRAHARRTDPETSHEAAASVENITERQAAVLRLSEELDPYTLEELVHEYRDPTSGSRGHERPAQSESGIRTRHRELVDRDLVVDTGDRRTTRSGRQAIVWNVNPDRPVITIRDPRGRIG